MKKWTRTQKLTGCLMVALLGGLSWFATATAPNDVTIRAIQCVDTASQETVFEEDYIKSATNDYDQWRLQIGPEILTYMQPSGVYCTLRPSVMAIENAVDGDDWDD